MLSTAELSNWNTDRPSFSKTFLNLFSKGILDSIIFIFYSVKKLRNKSLRSVYFSLLIFCSSNSLKKSFFWEICPSSRVLDFLSIVRNANSSSNSSKELFISYLYLGLGSLNALEMLLHWLFIGEC